VIACDRKMGNLINGRLVQSLLKFQKNSDNGEYQRFNTIINDTQYDITRLCNFK